MIVYDNKSWVLSLLCKKSGSVFPRVFPYGLLSAALALAFSLEVFKLPGDIISHPFVMQIYSIILGYVIVFRTNMALTRYWEGMTSVQQMISMWSDAFLNSISFFDVSINAAKDHTESANILLASKMQVLHWFSLLACVAVDTIQCGRDSEEMGDLTTRIEVAFAGLAVSELREARASVVDLEERRSWRHQEPEKGPPSEMKVSVVGQLTSAEKDELLKAMDPIFLVCRWILQEMTALIVAKHLRIPSPILSRIYQQLSNGMLGFHQALKVAIVPFPFPFAQMITLLLVGFLFFCPMMTAIFTTSSVLCPILTFLAVTGYWGLNEITVELEEPFGDDSNDLPIVLLQRSFVCMLIDQCRADVDSISKSMAWGRQQDEQQPPRPRDEVAILELNNELQRRGIKSRFETHLSLRDLQAYANLDVLERKFQSFDVAMVILPIVQRFLLNRATKEVTTMSLPLDAPALDDALPGPHSAALARPGTADSVSNLDMDREPDSAAQPAGPPAKLGGSMTTALQARPVAWDLGGSHPNAPDQFEDT